MPEHVYVRNCRFVGGLFCRSYRTVLQLRFTEAAQSMIARQQKHYILSTRPAQSIVARQQQQYMTYCQQDSHEAWLKTATMLHDI